MNKNRIRGGQGRTSGREAAKSISVKGSGRRSGGCARKAVGLTPGGLRCVPSGTEGTARFLDRGAGVSRRHSRWRKRAGPKAGWTHPAEGPNGPRKGLNGVASRTRVS